MTPIPLRPHIRAWLREGHENRARAHRAEAMRLRERAAALVDDWSAGMVEAAAWMDDLAEGEERAAGRWAAQS